MGWKNDTLVLFDEEIQISFWLIWILLLEIIVQFCMAFKSMTFEIQS